ncbi:MAG TPA: outer membrane beta-barrel family protein, partial [Rhizomicrobium sp.]|nr:outer membrane beta-barrel family protein [Rhizomicrobium sp.]
SNYGTEGRYNLGASAAYAAGGLSVTGNITFRHDIRKRTGTDVRTRIASSGNTASNQDLLNAQPRHAFVASLSAKYKFDPKNQINAGLSFNQRLVRPYTLEHNMATDTMGALISDNDRLGMGRGLEVSNQASAGYTYIFDDKGEFSIDLRRGQTHENRNTGYTSTFRTPVAAPALSELLLHSNIIQSEYTGEYVGNLWGGKIKAGYDLQQDHSVFNNYGGTIVGTTHTPDPAQTNLFIYGQSIHAGYATYQFVLGKDWHFLGGLRLEQTRVGTNQVTSGIVNKNSYFRAYPSLHVEYALDADQILSFSYSHRVSRPEADEVNPYPVFVDAFSVRAGNPLLLPQETHSLELGYETKLWGASLAATAFWRQTYNAATQVSRYISPTVLLNTLENLGESQSGGLDMTATGKLWSDFSYNLAATTFYNELNASNLGIGKIKAGLSYTLKGSLDYSLTPIDLVQVSGNYSGRRLTAQGYRAPAGLLNIGFRHKLRDDLALVTTLADVLNSQYSKTVTNIPTLSEVNDQHSMGRTFYIGLTWAFGGKPAKDQFDYSGGG